MFDVFGEVKKHISTSGRQPPKINSGVLMAMKAGFLASVLACVLVTAKNYIGDNINCITGFAGNEHRAIETFCFISSTFTLIDLGNENPHPGVGPMYPLKELDVDAYEQSLNEASQTQEEETTRHHSYYQWVPIVLALQSFVYYLPIWLWKQLERGYFDMILCGLHNISLNGEEVEKIKVSSKYFTKTLNHHSSYAHKLFMCECLAVSLAIGNLFFTNTFLGGEFFYFGVNAVKYLNTPAYDPQNPLNEIFPKVAKCSWHKFGSSGTVQTFDSMCVLPLNIVNEKTYVFLWFCYITIAVVTGVCIIYKILILTLEPFRNSLLDRIVKNSVAKSNLRVLLSSCNYGDWFLLYQLKSNMAYFPEWIRSVHDLHLAKNK